MSTNTKQRQIGDYLITSTIGHGSTGRVKLGIHQFTGEKVAIKIIPRSQLSSSIKITQAVERELAVLQLLDHPNLIDLHQVLQDENNVYFVTEYITGGELFYLINEKGKLSDSEAKNIFVQIAKALSWCHARNICHRDLKPENILLDQDQKSIKIADFGMATMQSSNALLKTSCGSPHYVSPEIIRGIPYYGPSADVWSAGIILYILLTGTLPFDDNHVGRLLAKIKTGRFKKIPDWVSPSARDLIYRILVIDPTQRISFNDILSHPWVISSTNTVHTTMLPIHSFSLQYNHWHDDQLKKPLILNSGDLYGPTKETLKVLWRDLTNDQIVSALKEQNPNLQKLTYQLLQHRLKRQFDFVERSTNSIEKLNFRVCHTTKEILPSPSKQNPSSRNSHVESCDELNQIHESFYIKQDRNVSSSAIFSLLSGPQIEPNRKIKSNLNTAFINLYPLLIPQPQLLINNRLVNSKKLFTTHETLISYSPQLSHLSSACILEHRLKNHFTLQSNKNSSILDNTTVINVSNRVKSFFQTKYNTFISALFEDKIPKQKLSQRIVRQEFAIQCTAKSEFIAAGKLNHILSDHFQGKLNGCMFPDGKILWSGEIDKSSFILDQRYKQSNKTCFLCKVRIVSDSKSLYKLVFIIHREEPTLVSTFANKLLDLLIQYENESQTVVKANKWILL